MLNKVSEDLTPSSGKLFQSKVHTSVLAWLLALSSLTMASVLFLNPSFSLTTGWQTKYHSNYTDAENVVDDDSRPNGKKDSSEFSLNELFPPESDRERCLSRFESPLFQKPSPHNPSPYLISKLRRYEDLHRTCGPYTKLYNESLQHLRSGLPSSSSNSTTCKYVVYTSMSGLGNRMLDVSSVFLYALLTDRVLLVQYADDSTNLFCEPFPNSTWLLPPDFPLRHHMAYSFDQGNPYTYGNMLKNKTLKSPIESSPFLLLYLAHNIDEQDSLFYCDKNQAQIRPVPWLIITSQEYFIPSLFWVDSFREELENLFPDKETIFHFLGRYLFQPSNEVWGLIIRFYQAYLAGADQRIGIQVRVFNTTTTPFQTVMAQIMSCIESKDVLPKVLDMQNPIASNDSSKNHGSKAVLITSLYPEYYEHMKDLYWTRETETGEVIGIFQPSHEEYEHYGNSMHTMKAWAEMYLLSMSDVLLTSAMSTFGYVAQGLGGLKPWILYMPYNGTAPNPACGQDISMEPCFHFPPRYGCRGEGVDAGGVVPYVRNCEDVNWGGVKIVNPHH